MFAIARAEFLNPLPYFNILATSSEELTSLPVSAKLWMSDFALADSQSHWSFPRWGSL